MTHVLSITREDGTEVEITASLKLGETSPIIYKARITYKKPTMDYWVVGNESDCTPAEIHAAKLELWEKLKPE